MKGPGTALTAASIAAALWAGPGAAAPQTMGPEIVQPGQVFAEAQKQVDGKVIDVERNTSMVSLLTADGPTRIVVPESSLVPAVAPRPGDSISAQYVDDGGAKLATFAKIHEAQSP